jgi:hypothetical protein
MLLCLLVTLPLFAACSDSGDTDVSDPDAVCQTILGICDVYMGGDQAACVADITGMEDCRLECAVKQTDCDTLDQCLHWQLGAGGTADEYCSESAGGDDLAACKKMCDMAEQCDTSGDWTAAKTESCKTDCDTYSASGYDDTDKAWFDACGDKTDCTEWATCTQPFLNQVK